MIQALRVVHLTSVHRPDDTRVFHKECASLAAAGYEVVLVAPGAPDTTVKGVRYHPVPVPRGRMQRFAQTGWQVFRGALAERGALYHFHDPELIPIGLLLRLCGKRVVYDIHEDVPAQLRTKHWVHPWLRRPIALAAEWAHWLVLRLLSGVVTAGDDVAAGLGLSDVAVVRNFPLLSEFSALPETRYRERPVEVVHVGNLSRIRASLELIQAIGLVPQELGARLVLVGRFNESRLEAEARQLDGWRRTDYIGWCERPQVAARLARARIGVVMFGAHPNHYAVRSNKLFEYMAAGLPVIGPDFPEWRVLIERTGCGLVADPTDAKAIACAINDLLRDPARAEAMGRRGRQAVLVEFNWEIESRRLLRLYRRILGPPAPDPDAGAPVGFVSPVS